VAEEKGDWMLGNHMQPIWICPRAELLQLGWQKKRKGFSVQLSVITIFLLFYTVRPYLVTRVGQNHMYTVHLRYSWKGNHQISGRIQCIYGYGQPYSWPCALFVCNGSWWWFSTLVVSLCWTWMLSWIITTAQDKRKPKARWNACYYGTAVRVTK